MSDFFDRASELETATRERALKAHQSRVKEAPIEPGYCNDCGADIPANRLAANPDAVCCFTCQSIREKREAQRGLGSR
ncbi:TraR/DksA family transcriptional regulator [Serratia marcescens]|uniref:TraR/DksA family transcriptional regulator n=1 Tax=Serratia marcescens TaxID=615 RepID=A0ABD5BI95_SERMA|nr:MULTISPECIES: TraR/DksA family transcriptional regulator [Yersiniaceae]MCZ6928694.1 conjugal transfer protein TraR [Serratia marcescens]MDE5234347.1 TraR/DksA family transcriptional regulator [Serratia marcescens]MDE5257486.1 TraR/DksA family transcriptional regulator [Serratia marcescens]MDQ9402302.1 TraR/DksA family transcriptional regulator [Serratia marcescens]MDQ9424647.1 TraR/DksA family transcriptional regulator [Serratia marcescens]